MLKTLLNYRQKQRAQSGFTLIESMIAVVVFSFGLLGVAGVMIVSVKNNHNGYLRTQATFLAHSMIENMRNNSWDVWRNNYDGTYGGTFASVAGMCTATAPCACNATIARERQMWSNMIVQMLPGGAGQIACVPSKPLLNPEPCNVSNPPYVGICTVTVSWNESNETNASDAQTVVVQVNP